MASLSLLLAGLLVLTTEMMCIQTNSDYGGDMVMEQDELLGLFEVLDSLLDDPTWAQMHPLPCTDTPWPGVQCEIGQDQDPPIFHITKIHVGPDLLTPPCKSTAKLSESFSKLPYLKTLSIFNCFTITPVFLSPSLFSSLPSLEHLALQSNPTLYGEISPKLAEITSLRVLCFSQNNLMGVIPKEIGGLVSLEQLDLSYNFFNGSIPQEIGGLKSLTILDLSWNGLQGEVPCSLGQLPLLQKIDLGSNKLQGRVPQGLGALKRLVLLDLSHNSLTGPIPETLYGIQQLEYLIIDDNPINTGMPLFIGALRKLTVLSCSRCGLIGPIPSSLSSIKNLRALSLDNNSLNETVPPTLGTLPNLDLLNLSQNQLSGEVLLPEEFINRLGKRLDLKGNNGLCTRYQLYKNKSTPTFWQTPSCLDTAIPRLAHPDDSKKMKPIWYQGNITSNTHRLDQKYVPLILIVCFIGFFLL